MKKLIYLLAFAFIASTAFVSCDDDDSTSPFKTVTLGAQANTDINGFYSFNNQKTYSLEEAKANQTTIDLLCFYEEGKNDISLSSPGANITDIFTGDNAPETWTTTDTTFFYQVETGITATEFAALTESSTIIETLYNADEARRKAKLLEVGDIYAFETEDNIHGLFLVTEVTQGETGSVQFEYILKK